jgi:hypothetical protein
VVRRYMPIHGFLGHYLFSKGINYPRPIACIPPVGPIINQVLGNGNSKSVPAALGQNAHPTFSQPF